MPVARRRTAPSAQGNTGPPIQSVRKGRSKKLSMCIYGEPGIGKTRLVGSCAELGRTLILRPPVDHTDSIVDHEVDEWVLHDWAEADDALLYLRNDGKDLYDWVWLDSLSLWQDQGLDDIWEQVISEKPHRARYGLDKQEFGINMGRIGRWVRHMVGCPDWHFGVTCHPRVTESTEDEEDPNEKLMPWVQGKMMAPKVCGYMNLVGFYHWGAVGRSSKARDVRVLDLNSTEKFYAKDQFDSMPSGRLINPTMPKLVEAIVNTNKYKQAEAKGRSSSNGRARTTTQRRRTAARV
jgi:hypothetical protein